MIHNSKENDLEWINSDTFHIMPLAAKKYEHHVNYSPEQGLPLKIIGWNEPQGTVSNVNSVPIVFFLYSHPIMIFGRYCKASAKCVDWISSLPAKSEIVRDNFRMR